jgi:hypothetical protein
LCLDNMNEIGRASFFADATGMVEDRGTIAKTFLDGHAGRVWLKQEADTRYALILTDEGSCGIAGPDADGPEVLKLVLGNLRNRHLETSNQGSTVLVSNLCRYTSQVGVALKTYMRSFRNRCRSCRLLEG